MKSTKEPPGVIDVKLTSRQESKRRGDMVREQVPWGEFNLFVQELAG